MNLLNLDIDSLPSAPTYISSSQYCLLQAVHVSRVDYYKV